MRRSLRIISGLHKGRKLYPPAFLPVRPTTDFSKTALFNILANHFDFEKIGVLDLFTGTGSISFEFASRGCTSITSVDADQGCVKYVRETAAILNFPFIQAVKSDVFRFIESCTGRFDVIFAGPPYAL